MRNAILRAVGSFAPEKVLSNQYFNELFNEDVDTWLRENLQIYERRWCSEGQSTADLCVEAGRKALERGGLKANELDMLIVATDTPEYVSPATSAKVQYRLGATKAGIFDLNSACTSFVTAMDVATQFLKAHSSYRYIMVIGAYAMSKYLDMEDKKTATLFADGAGAVILEAKEESTRGYLGSELNGDGQYHDWMGVYGGQSAIPLSQEVLNRKEHKLKFIKPFPKTLNPDKWTEMVLNLCRQLGTSPNEVDHFFFPQININQIHETLDRMGVDRQKAPTIMHYYGYTGSAAIPMALDKVFTEGKLKEGDLLFFIASGVGLSFSALAMRY